MINIIRTDSSQTDFILLVKLLDADLALRDGDEHSFYAQFNTIDQIRNVVVGYVNDVPIACGAFKYYHDTIAEVKRMFTLPEFRGKGYAGIILKELEKWGKELSFTSFVLETGKKQPEAVRLYEKNGYVQIPNYDQYVGMENSICFQKDLL